MPKLSILLNNRRNTLRICVAIGLVAKCDGRLIDMLIGYDRGRAS